MGTHGQRQLEHALEPGPHERIHQGASRLVELLQRRLGSHQSLSAAGRDGPDRGPGLGAGGRRSGVLHRRESAMDGIRHQPVERGARHLPRERGDLRPSETEQQGQRHRADQGDRRRVRRRVYRRARTQRGRSGRRGRHERRRRGRRLVHGRRRSGLHSDFHPRFALLLGNIDRSQHHERGRLQRGSGLPGRLGLRGLRRRQCQSVRSVHIRLSGRQLQRDFHLRRVVGDTQYLDGQRRGR